MNRAILIGRLTRDLELRKTASGTSVLSFTVAINRRVSSGQEPQTDFINCVAWNKTAELMAQYLHKGSQVGLEGRIQTRNYENQQGQKVYVTEVVADNVQFLDPKPAGTTRSDYPAPTPYESEPSYENNQDFNDEPFSLDAFDPSSEDLPF